MRLKATGQVVIPISPQPIVVSGIEYREVLVPTPRRRGSQTHLQQVRLNRLSTEQENAQNP